MTSFIYSQSDKRYYFFSLKLMIGFFCKEICRHRKENTMKKNIRLILLGEAILLAAIFLFNLFLCNGGLSAIAYFIDLPSLIVIFAFLILGLIIMGEGGNFIKAFSVGIHQYSLLELKNISGAVRAAQNLTVFGAIFAIIISGMVLLGRLDDLYTIGANLAICLLAGFYAVIIEFFLFPLRLNAENKMNEEMDMDDE